MILDFHEFQLMSREPEKHKAGFLAIWNTLAERTRTGRENSSSRSSTSRTGNSPPSSGMSTSARPWRSSAAPTPAAR